jgi:hypothetical protein
VRPYDPHWIEPLPSFSKEMLRFALRWPRAVIILPPEFLKTTLLSQLLPLWLTFRASVLGQLMRGMLLSEEEDMAIQNLSVVKWHIMNNEDLRADFSDHYKRPLVVPDETEQVWREDAIIVRRKGTSKDPTWVAKGINSTGVQGRRLDWLIGDDVVTPANAFSPAKREKALRDWDMQITARLVETGKAVVCGNFNDPEDLVSTLAKRKRYRVFRRPALAHPERPSEPLPLSDPRAVCLWPSNWSRARLAAEHDEKPTRFERLYLLRVGDAEGRKLRTRWVTQIEEADTPWRYCRFFMAIDPAPGSEEDDPDFFNVSIGGLHAHGLDLVESFDIRETPVDQVRLVGALHDRYDRLGTGIFAIGVSRVALDRYFQGALTIGRPDLEHKLVPISAGNVAKEERLEALGPYARSGWLRVQRRVWADKSSDPDDQWQELTLAEQWRTFPGVHDDKLDGLDILIRTAREFDTELSTSTFRLKVQEA